MENRTFENDFVKREQVRFTGRETITFKHVPHIYEKEEYDWYIVVAIEKADKVKIDRHLLTSELLLSYRWAIREGYQHQLDSSLKNRYDYPRNQNTIKGINSYINRIKKLSDNEMKSITENE